MSNNRTEQQALVDGLTPTVDLDELQPAMIQDGYVFKKDIAETKTITGTGSEILSFATTDQFTVTVDGNGTATITIQDLEIGQKGKIRISKTLASSSLVVQGCDNVNLGEIKRTGSFFLEVVNIGGEIVIYETGRGRSGSIPLSDLSSTSGSIAASNFFRYSIYGKICTFTAQINFSYTATDATSLIIKIDNRDFGTFKEDIATISTYLIRSGIVTDKKMSAMSYIIDQGTYYDLNIRGSEFFTSGDQVIVYLTGSFEIV